MTEETKQGLTRREVLKKGAIVGGTLGAVMWVAPAVRAVETTPGAAQIPSETSCCLKIVSLVPVYAVVGSAQVQVTLTVQNCSTHKTDLDVRGQLWRSNDDGASWIQLDNGGSQDIFQIGGLGQGQLGFNTFNDFEITPGETYKYKAVAQYDCYEGNVKLSDDAPQDIPHGFFESGSVTVPSP